MMAYISKLDTKFVTFVSRKYKKYKVKFSNFDDYILWLFYKFCKCNEDFYYRKLEKDLWDYSNWQTGSPRENELKDDSWKKMEKDPYGLFNGNENYVRFLRNHNWNEKNKR